jgi:large subunit ribosomal protein L2
MTDTPSHLPRLQGFKPTSPGVRHKRVLKVRQGPQEVPKALRRSHRRSGGRNATGRITVRHIGGGVRSFRREVTAFPGWTQATVVAIQVDPHRSAPLARVQPEPWIKDGVLLSPAPREYILAGKGMVPGTVVHCGPLAPVQPHARLPRWRIPRGSSVYNVERNPQRGGQRVKTAGSWAETIRRSTVAELGAPTDSDEATKTRLQRPSKGFRWVPSGAYATRGRVAGEDHRHTVDGRAGARRRRGIRPTVRGVAMNPIDHPHGGRTGGGKPEVTPWAKRAKGKPTRSKRKTSVFVVKG